MTLFRVLKQETFIGIDKTEVLLSPGDFVSIAHKGVVNKLLRMGVIGDVKHSWEQKVAYQKPAPSFSKTLRVGIWLKTSTYYSGGRIHLYQYAHALAHAGADVYMISNKLPAWRHDYPINDNIFFLKDASEQPPDDLDIIVTDSKGSVGAHALSYKRKHPHVPFVCFNFETPNWVKHYAPDYASKLQAEKDIFKYADLLISNSHESAKFLKQWVGKNIPTEVLQPAVNTFALAKVNKVRPHVRPYMVWSARNPSYKNGKLAADAIKALPDIMDLILVGQAEFSFDTPKHKCVAKQSISDAEKYTLFHHAHAVLAPSLFEGYGMVPQEALACGTPCIVYDLPVLRESYGDKLIYCKWNDPKDFKRKVSDIANSAKPAIDSADARDNYGIDIQRKRIENLPYHCYNKRKISAQLIVYWGFVPESIESIYPYVDEITVAYGPDRFAKDLIEPDNSLQLLQEMDDPEHKIRIETRQLWKDKLEMRTWCADQITGNYLLILDGDEIWAGMEQWLKADIDYGCPAWCNLWHGDKHWIYDSAKLAGLRWGKKVVTNGSTCPHYRWSRWRRSYYFKKHPMPVDANNQPLHIAKFNASALRSPKTVIYHLGHALPKYVMQAKHDYYIKRDGDDAGRRKRRDVWHKWKGKLGDVGDGIVAKVDWQLPDIVKRGIARL